jgi:uncharacterized repeat protein (TIGR01451 family)
MEPNEGETSVIYWQPNSSIRTLSSSLQLLAVTLCIGGVLQSPTLAATQLQCNAPGGTGATLLNRVSYTYGDGTLALSSISETISSQVTTGGALSIAAKGIKDSDGNLVYTLGTIATALNHELLTLGWSQDEANLGSAAAVQAFAGSPADATYQQIMAVVKAAIAQAVPSRTAVIKSGSADQPIAVALLGLASSSLNSIGLNATEAETATNAAIAVVSTTTGDVLFSQMAQTAFQDANTAVPTQAVLLNAAKQAIAADLSQLQAGKGTGLRAGDTIRFEFTLINSGSAAIQLNPPTLADLQQTGMVGSAAVTAVGVEGVNPLPDSLSLSSGEQVNLWVEAKVGTLPAAASPLALALGNGCGSGVVQQTITLLPPTATRLIDPFGRITGCNGELLPDYRGIQVALYNPDSNNNTGDVSSLLRLPTTELPDNPNNKIPAGLEPNRQNINPFSLSNRDQGKYSFLFRENQLRSGQTYILVVSPPSDSEYSERRIRLTVGQRTSEGVSYRATSLDGRPIRSSDRQTSVNGVLRIASAEQVGLVLGLLDLDTSICQSQAIQIVKTGDRASAAPGDTVIYRLLVRNLSTTSIENLVITDTLPLGFSFLDQSVRGEIQGRNTTVTASRTGSTVSLQVNGTLPEGGVLNIAYGTQLTPDALRGNGQNSATASGRRDDNEWVVRDGPAIHRLRVEAGIVTDCGTILGRVFEDKNFDGEQQVGEPGIPNAVIYLDDGNRITTDANGLFSVANVLPGHRTGALDLTSLEGYTLAPNLRFIERNSPSRLVQLEPGGMVRMNFAVTPTFQEEAGQ